LQNPEKILRFGGWSLGESTHLINDAHLIHDAMPPSLCRTFLLDTNGNHTLPVWVDHVGMAGTRYAVGNVLGITSVPAVGQLPQISPAT
jgi:CRISPR-associated protein Cas5t